MNHIEGRKKERIGGEVQDELSVSQYTIIAKAIIVKINGVLFIDGVIKGDKERGLISHLTIAPLITAPILRLMVGIINGDAFSKDMFGAGWFDRYSKQKDVRRAEYITVRPVAIPRRKMIIEFIGIDIDDSMIMSLE